MDLVTHAITGAITGAAFDKPLLGAAVGVAPDLVLGFRRKAKPTIAYILTHSPLLASTDIAFATVAAGASLSATGCVLAAYWSHIALDVQTHGNDWAPGLFRRLRLGSDWEFFNRAWWLGLLTAILWSTAWLTVSFASGTGFRSLHSALSTIFPI